MKTKRIYEIFNMSTGKWEPTEMTEDEYIDMQCKMDTQSDLLEAEYEIITKIITQQMGSDESNKKSMD
tara:strand:- start:4692 stop:4895 length:204 start_codon:yes stop_codon:yes gene_type:complete